MAAAISDAANADAAARERLAVKLASVGKPLAPATTPIASENTPIASDRGPQTPVNSVKTPANSVKTPANSVKTPANSVKTPANGSETSVAGDRAPVAGDRAPVAGASGPQTPANTSTTTDADVAYAAASTEFASRKMEYLKRILAQIDEHKRARELASVGAMKPTVNAAQTTAHTCARRHNRGCTCDASATPSEVISAAVLADAAEQINEDVPVETPARTEPLTGVRPGTISIASAHAMRPTDPLCTRATHTDALRTRAHLTPGIETNTHISADELALIEAVNTPHPPPTQRIRVLGIEMIVTTAHHVNKLIPEMPIPDMQHAHDKIQLFIMIFDHFTRLDLLASDNDTLVPIRKRTIIPGALHDCAYMAMVERGYGRMITGYTDSAFEFECEVEIDFATATALGHPVLTSLSDPTDTITRYARHIRAQAYELIAASPMNVCVAGLDCEYGCACEQDGPASPGAHTPTTPHHNHARSSGVVPAPDEFAAECYHVWYRLPDTHGSVIMSPSEFMSMYSRDDNRPIPTILLCTSAGIVAVSPRHHAYAEVLRAAFLLGRDLLTLTYLCVFIMRESSPNGPFARFCVEYPRENAIASPTARAAGICTLMHLIHTWTCAMNVPAHVEFTMYIDSDHEIIAKAMRVEESIPRRNRKCVLKPTGTCYVHDRACRRNRRLDPTSSYWHLHQMPRLRDAITDARK